MREILLIFRFQPVSALLPRSSSAGRSPTARRAAHAAWPERQNRWHIRRTGSPLPPDLRCGRSLPHADIPAAHRAGYAGPSGRSQAAQPPARKPRENGSLQCSAPAAIRFPGIPLQAAGSSAGSRHGFHTEPREDS